MCGRTACTLAPDDIVRACRFKNSQGKFSKPVWKDPPGGQQYYPCYNIAPTAHTPVLLSSQHYRGELEQFSERVVQPMKWGLVPLWHKGDPYKLQYETNNCRAEGMLTKRTYKVPLEKGNRCVVLADGFFEWKRGAQGKQPYFIYFPQQKSPTDTKPDLHKDSPSPTKPSVKQEQRDTKLGVDSRVKQEPADSNPNPDQAAPSSGVHVKTEPEETETGPHNPTSSTGSAVKQEPVVIKTDPDGVETGVKEEEKGSVCQSSVDAGAKETAAEQALDDGDEEWQGKRLLTMAGVFDVWHPPDGSAPLYSYSVITVDATTPASPSMSGIHDRMPAILSTEEEVNAWLDFAHVPLSQAVKMIRPTESVSMHMVSPVVNNSRNKSAECVQLYNPKQVKKTASSTMMMNWLKKAAPPPGAPPDSKKQRLQ